MAGSTSKSDLVTVNLAKKRVYLRFCGFLSRAQAEALRDAYAAAIAKVGNGYTAVSIFEDFMPGTVEVQEIISSMIRMASDGGCRKAARVASGSVFGQMQLGRLQREVKAAYPVFDCKTVEEADAYLDRADS